MRNQEYLLEFVRNNFDPEDIWDGIGEHDDCYMSLAGALSAAQDEGWIDPQNPDTYETWHLEQMAEHLGLTIGPARATVDAYHDDNGHAGAVQWCTNPLCAGE